MITRSENSAMIFLFLALTVLLKMNSNLSRFHISRLIEKARHSKTTSKKDVLRIFYLIQNYIKHKLIDSEIYGASQLGQDSQEKNEVTFFIKYMLEEHKKTCNKIVCFCRQSEIKIESSAWVHFEEYFKGNLSFKALHLLNDMLR